MSGAFQLFNTLTDNNVRLEQISSDEAALVKAWSIISQDIYHIRNRVHRDEQGGYQPALEGDAENGLRFIRGGLPPVEGLTPGGLQRVLYRLNKGRLQRVSWPVVDLDPASTPETQTLLSELASWKVKYLTKEGLWIDIWPLQNQELNQDSAQLPLHEMPRMVRFAMAYRDGREVSKTFVGLGE
ncbi:type II secretion system protein GspJ [Marinobacterium sp. YM272]|uniref:type II secretion system protein GspJ n=1 Tax=Marinobacterium sp. YM272 TaxID=3421654 RepID=UPI003D7F9A82